MYVSRIFLYTVLSFAYGTPVLMNVDVLRAAVTSSATPPALHSASQPLSQAPSDQKPSEKPQTNTTMPHAGGPTRRLLLPGQGPESHATLDMISDFIGGVQSQFGDVTTFIGKAIDAVGDGFDSVVALGHLAESAANGVSNLISVIRGGPASLLLSPGMKEYQKSLKRVSAEAKARNIDTTRLDRLTAKLNERVAYAEKHKKQG